MGTTKVINLTVKTSIKVLKYGIIIKGRSFCQVINVFILLVFIFKLCIVFKYHKWSGNAPDFIIKHNIEIIVNVFLSFTVDTNTKKIIEDVN